MHPKSPQPSHVISVTPCLALFPRTKIRWSKRSLTLKKQSKNYNRHQNLCLVQTPVVLTPATRGRSHAVRPWTGALNHRWKNSSTQWYNGEPTTGPHHFDCARYRPTPGKLYQWPLIRWNCQCESQIQERQLLRPPGNWARKETKVTPWPPIPLGGPDTDYNRLWHPRRLHQLSH